VHTSIIEPEYPPRREPRRCDIGVHLTTTMSHRRGSAARGAGAVVKGASAGTWAGLTGGSPGMLVGSRPPADGRTPPALSVCGRPGEVVKHGASGLAPGGAANRFDVTASRLWPARCGSGPVPVGAGPDAGAVAGVEV